MPFRRVKVCVLGGDPGGRYLGVKVCVLGEIRPAWGEIPGGDPGYSRG